MLARYMDGTRAMTTIQATSVGEQCGAGKLLDLLVYCLLFFFFFQAEDGIRDSSVTGVQTCALPISFIEAGALAVIVIAIMLWIALRHFGDVLLTLVPLLVAGAVTLELMVLLGEPLNFANVIALPLLLGVGVAFKIYYIMAWRAGRTNLLQSTLTRAVFFSALTS